MNIHFIISEESSGQRLDAEISARLDSLSRSRISRAIKSGDILVNGGVRKPGYRLAPGDMITGLIPSETAGFPVPAGPETIAIDIIYEDAHILIINKAAGMVVHPAPGNTTGTLVNALLSHCPEIGIMGGDDARSGIVHRLDKDTSGVMVAAKTRQALTFLQKEFKYRRVEKRYLAIARGGFTEENGKIVLPIGRHPVKRKLMATPGSSGRHAETRWTVLGRGGDATLVEAELKTGRTHQIRVHFKAIGHPLVGDSVYGVKADRRSTTIKTSEKSVREPRAVRQMLHAWKLEFRHPWSGQRVQFMAGIPEDFKSYLSGMGIDPSGFV